MEGCSVCAIGDEREARTAPQHVRVFLRFPTNTTLDSRSIAPKYKYKIMCSVM